MNFNLSFSLSRIALVALGLSQLLSTSCLEAQDSSRTAPMATICSQNVYRYGDEKSSRNEEKKARQLQYLVSRFKRARCDVIALQEVPGEEEEISKAILDEISEELFRRTSKRFTPVIGRSNDRFIRNAFLVR